jgi:predicted phage terminase large subunit-like protein
MAGRVPLLHVPASDADDTLNEIVVRYEARRRNTKRAIDPALGTEDWEEAAEKLKQMQTDINAYGEYVFGLAPAKVHRLWNQIANDVIERNVPQNKVLFIAPPNTAKSTWNSIIRPAHYLGQHPDHNIVFLTASDPMSYTFGSAVRSALADNPRHRQVFPDKAARPHRARGWSGDGLYLFGTPSASKDPAYKSVSYTGNIMGARAHGMLIDDPMDQKNAVSASEQRKAKDYYDQTLVPRLQPGSGWLIAVMTRFHENDLASHFIEKAEKSGDWIIVRTPQIATNDPDPDPLGRLTGELLWPERLDANYVEQERSRMSIAQFNLIHQGDPTGIGGDVFKSESWFQPLPFDFWSGIFPKCQIVQAWDLAFSENRQACFTVGMTVAVDDKMNMYILHVLRERLTVIGLEDAMVKLIQIGQPLVCGIEVDNFHKQLTEVIAQRVLNRAMTNIQLIRPDTDKIARAMLPAARAEQGKVFINTETEWYRAFITECLGFPNTRFKDQVDTFGLAALMVQRLSEMQRRWKPVMVEHVMSAGG